MRKINITINHLIYLELDKYLMSLNGIKKVNISKNNLLSIDVIYDENVISSNLIKLEIYAFLEIGEMPTLFSFNKYSHEKINIYEFILENICCEYCYASAIEELFDLEGVEKIESNFYENYFEKGYDERDNYIIRVSYNPNIVDIDKIKQIEF